MPAEPTIVIKKTLSSRVTPESFGESAKEIMTSYGFILEDNSGNKWTFSPPPTKSVKKGSPLRGVSNLKFICTRSDIEVVAELDRLKNIRNLLIWLPIVLFALFLTGLLSIGYFAGRGTEHGFGVDFAKGWTWSWYSLIISFAPVSPWIFLGPYLMKRTKWKYEMFLKRTLSSVVASSY